MIFNQYKLSDTYNKQIVSLNQNMISQSRLLIKQSHSFAKLIQLLPSGQLKICSQGQKILSNALIGQLIIISIEGEPTSLFHNFINKEIELNPDPNMANSINSQVWISTLPYEHPNEKKNIYFLQTFLKKKQDARKLHIFCSLISSVILLNLYENSNIDFLEALKGKVILSKQKEMLSIRDCIGSILVLFRDDKNHEQMSSKANQFNQMITTQNIYPYVQNTYYFMDAYGFTKDENVQLENYKMLKKILYSLQQNIRKKIVDGLMFGPILKEYITKIVRQFNQKGIIQLESITKNIEIDEGYDVFNQVYRQYHANIKNIIGNNQNKPMKNLAEELQILKTDAIQAYSFKCADQFYRFKLNEALNKNEKQILSINNQLFRNSNVQFLERESSRLLTGIQQNNYNNKKIKSQIQGIVNRYEQQAGGDSKYELLSQFLSKFVPQLMKNTQDNGKTQQVLKKMELIKKQNKQLQKKLLQWKKIQSKSSGCC